MEQFSNMDQSATLFVNAAQQQVDTKFPPAGAANIPDTKTKADRPRTGGLESSVTVTTSSSTGVKPARRRDKPQLSCNPCRNRKSRCDRKQPCSNCASRGQTCTYAHGQHPAGLPPRPSMMSGTLGVHDRLVQLEKLVKSLIPATAADGPTSQPSRGSLPVSAPTLDPSYNPPAELEAPKDAISDSGSISCAGASDLHYVVGEHWAALLNNIAELREHFDREEQLKLTEDPWSGQMAADSSPRPPGHALLLYPTQRASRKEILDALPPKDAVDRYLSYYFNHLDMASSVVHGPTFLKQYDEFWTNSSSTPMNWIGLLYTMMSLSARALALMNPGNEADTQTKLSDLYHEKVVQCLILGDYTKCGPYVLETMSQYVYIEFGKHLDSGKDIWFLLGLTVTLAMRMGFHRDPSHFPGISPLQGEIRRRIWVNILMGDVLISNQMGMPRMLTDYRCDTAEPRNLHDSDLDEFMTEPPPPRPETEYTRALGIIARRRILIPLGRIADLMTAVRPCTYADVMRHDEMLTKAADSLPPPLKMKPMSASVTDSPIVIIDRLFITHMICKGRTMLHRRFLQVKSPCNKEDMFQYSRTTCIDAALASLEIQRIYDEETAPGGQLSQIRWRLSSVQNHHFLTATMILCSVLYHCMGSDRTEEIKTALRRSRAIWVRNSSKSREAKKAAEIVNIALARNGPETFVAKSSKNGDDVAEDSGGHDDQPQQVDCHPSLHASSTSSNGEGNEGEAPPPEIDFDENRVIQYGMGFDESNNFSYPAVPSRFSLQHEVNHQIYTFETNHGGANNGLDGWVTDMNDFGMQWDI
ncbi:fusarisetin A cluster transcription factor [Rhypophila decipiens]|uniref:Fusarisetin A cluster transcription factor n=1 Tax=Rhypophila decipiens TaxID=261697 RepID=A0AAN6Y6Z7_9PEZI|nr:fusarisetin A cluster transcription factor [Rhypophila decipiens]